MGRRKEKINVLQVLHPRLRCEPLHAVGARPGGEPSVSRDVLDLVIRIPCHLGAVIVPISGDWAIHSEGFGKESS